MRPRRAPMLERFRRSAGGTAGLEFALVAPVLFLLMLAGIQTVAYINAVRKVELLAASISEMISQATPPNSSTTTATVNASDLHFGLDSSLVLFPYLMTDANRQGIAWSQDINIDYASVQFTNIPMTTCAGTDQSACYLANVVWTSNGAPGTNYRVCILPQLAMDDTAAPNRTTLPRSIFGPGSIIVVDIVFTFRPTFASAFLPALRIARSVYVQPRYATLINFDTTNNDGIATKCPGF